MNLVKVKNKKITSDFGGNPPPLVDLIHQNVFILFFSSLNGVLGIPKNFKQSFDPFPLIESNWASYLQFPIHSHPNLT